MLHFSYLWLIVCSFVNFSSLVCLYVNQAVRVNLILINENDDDDDDDDDDEAVRAEIKQSFLVCNQKCDVKLSRWIRWTCTLATVADTTVKDIYIFGSMLH